MALVHKKHTWRGTKHRKFSCWGCENLLKINTQRESTHTEPNGWTHNQQMAYYVLMNITRTLNFFSVPKHKLTNNLVFSWMKHGIRFFLERMTRELTFIEIDVSNHHKANRKRFLSYQTILGWGFEKLYFQYSAFGVHFYFQ